MALISFSVHCSQLCKLPLETPPAHQTHAPNRPLDIYFPVFCGQHNHPSNGPSQNPGWHLWNLLPFHLSHLIITKTCWVWLPNNCRTSVLLHSCCHCLSTSTYPGSLKHSKILLQLFHYLQPWLVYSKAFTTLQPEVSKTQTWSWHSPAFITYRKFILLNQSSQSCTKIIPA